MRKLLLTVALAGLMAGVVMAQGFLGGRMGGAGFLVSLPDVQKELKLTDDQKKAFTDAAAKGRGIFRAEPDERAKLVEEYNKAMTKAIDGLKSEQKARLLGIEAQVAEKNKQPQIFTRAEVQKALKLDDKQKDTVKDTLGNVEKDAKEIFEDAKGGGFEKFAEVREKVGKLNAEAYEKITKTFSDTQKKAWKDLQGEKFEVKMPNFKGKGKKSKDDF